MNIEGPIAIPLLLWTPGLRHLRDKLSAFHGNRAHSCLCAECITGKGRTRGAKLSRLGLSASRHRSEHSFGCTIEL